MITITIPGTLRRFTGDNSVVEVQADTVRAALLALADQHPKLRSRVFTPSGDLFAFIGIFLNGSKVRQAQAGTARVAAGDTLALVPAIAGG